MLATFYVSQGKNIKEITQILSQTAEDLQLHTKTGKKIFRERKRFLQDFVQSLRNEIAEKL